MLSPRGEGPSLVDAALQGVGLRRPVRLRVSSLLLALCLVRDSDDVFCAPRRTLAVLADAMGVDVLEPPLPLPSFSVSQVWHERARRDPAHRWLRRAVRKAFA